MNRLSIEEVIDEYYERRMTIKELAAKHGVSAGYLFYKMRDNGCEFIKTRRHQEGEQARKNRSEARKGWKMSEEQKRMISERNSCDYNGLNGYGHTKMHNRGYVLAYVPKHPRAHKDGYVMLHTVLMEISIGRYLLPNEVVHHINHDRSDNRIENLQLMDKHEHHSMHMKERWNGLSTALPSLEI